MKRLDRVPLKSGRLLSILQTYWFVLVIPGIFVVLQAFLDAAQSPYWLHFDPSYAYLLNGLNLVKGLVPVHVDHPGTPLHVLCFVVIWALNIGRSVPDLINRVLIDPELYMHAVHAVMVFGFLISSVALAVYVYNKTNDKMAALLSQLSGMALLPYFSLVTPDPLIIITMNIFSISFLFLFFSKTKKEEFLAVLFLALTCAFGAAVKIIFIPLLIVPLAVLAWRSKCIFMAVFMAGFVLFTLPIISKYPEVWKWVTGLLTHTGIHGQGARGFIDGHTYLFNWGKIFSRHWVLVLSAVSALISGITFVLKDRDRREGPFLIAVASGLLLQFAMVAKHYEDHYLVPGIGLCAVLFVFLYFGQMGKTPLLRRWTMAFIILFTAQGLFYSLQLRKELQHFKNDVLTFNEKIHLKYPHCALLGAFPSYFQEYALLEGSNYSRSVAEELSGLYQDAFYLNIYTREISDFKQKRIFADDLLKKYPCVIYLGVKTDYLLESPYVFRLLEQGNNQSAYILESSTERQSVALFEASQDFLQKGDYEKAFLFALKSRELNYQPRGKIDYFLQLIYPHVKK